MSAFEHHHEPTCDRGPRFHQDQDDCEYAVPRLKPNVGDEVRLCTADARWKVVAFTERGYLVLDPLPGPGWTWYQQRVVAPAHVTTVLALDGAQ